MRPDQPFLTAFHIRQIASLYWQTNNAIGVYCEGKYTFPVLMPFSLVQTLNEISLSDIQRICKPIMPYSFGEGIFRIKEIHDFDRARKWASIKDQFVSLSS